MEKGRKFLLYLSLSLFMTIALIYSSFLPAVELPGISAFDPGAFIQHMAAYFVYGILLQGTFRYVFLSRKQALLACLIVGIFIAGLTETIQLFIPYRVAALSDFMADAIGVIAGAVAKGLKT